MKRFLFFLGLLWAACAVGADRHLGPVVSVFRDSDKVLSVSQGGLFEGVGKDLKLILRPSFRVFDMALVPGRKPNLHNVILVGGKPGESSQVRLANPRMGETDFVPVANDVVYHVAVSPDGNEAAMACADDRVYTLELRGFPGTAPVERLKHTADALAVAYSPDGSKLVSAGLDGVILVSQRDGGEPRILQQHTAGVECLVFSPDGRFFASGSRDAKVRIHTADGDFVRTYDGLGMEARTSGIGALPRVLALAWGGPRGELIAGTSDGGIYRLSAADDTWERLDSSGKGPVYAVAFDADGGLLIGGDGEVRR